jgi:hypothetical protein
MSKCPLCKKEQTIIVRLAEDGRTETKNETEICENPDCSLYIDISKLKTWIVKYRPKEKK